MSDGLARVAPAWEDCRVPGNSYDARARFKCSALEQVLDGPGCVQRYRTGTRIATACTGCPAGRARARLLAPVAVVKDPPPAPPPPPPSVALSVVEALVAQVAALTERVAALEARSAGVQASVDAAVNAVTLPRTATRTVRMGKFGFCFKGLDLERVHRWCLAHNFSLSHLVRCAIRLRALADGVDLPVYASGVSKGFKDASPQKYSGICVPEAWLTYLEPLRRRRLLSAFVITAVNAYMEANP